MRKLIVLVAACIFSLNAIAQDYQNDKSRSSDKNTVKYCAKMKDGKMMVTKDDVMLTADAKLANGMTIKTDGTIIKEDGKQIALKNGECIDSNGNMKLPTEGKKDQM